MLLSGAAGFVGSMHQELALHGQGRWPDPERPYRPGCSRPGLPYQDSFLCMVNFKPTWRAARPWYVKHSKHGSSRGPRSRLLGVMSRPRHAGSVSAQDAAEPALPQAPAAATYSGTSAETCLGQ